MKNLNNRGVSLIEMLAVVVILGMLIMIMIPNVSKLINKGKEDSYEDLKTSILSGTKLYISDYKYEISLTGTCSEENNTKKIRSINEKVINDSKIPISILVEEGYLQTNKNNTITDPRDNDKILDIYNSYTIVTYNCNDKDFNYEEVQDENLIWK